MSDQVIVPARSIAAFTPTPAYLDATPHDLTLPRLQQDDYGTFGEFVDVDGNHVAFTCERPWKNNAADVSCFPAGRYRCELAPSDHFKRELYHLRGVPNRDGCEIHNANWPSQLEGCIAIGEQIATIEGKRGVTNSLATLNAFMTARTGVQWFWITVIDVPHSPRLS